MVDEETSKKIQDLQMLEQNFQSLIMQKQSFQIESNETKSALEEISKSKDDVFRVLGQIMIKANKDSLKKELKEKGDLLNLRLKSIEKQETILRENIERIRNDIIGKIN